MLISPKTSPSIVENITGESITVNNKLNICSEKARSPTSPQNPQPTAKQPRIDLDDAPEISTFFDRTSEISTLKQWILENRTRLISILGLSGIGKSAIALQLIQHIQYEFDSIIWRSLRDAPPLQTLQTDLIKFLSQQQETNPPNPPLSRGGEEIQPPSPRGGEEIQPPSPPRSLGGLGGVIDYLRSHRCLIILDDVQTIFSSGQLAGNYKPGYENYGTFFKQIAESCHNSCIVLLSWEKPREIAALEGYPKNCQTLQLNSLGEPAREIFTEKSLSESEKWSELIDFYRGNPLWLNIVAAAIQDLFSGKVSEFLSYDSLVLGDLEYLLHPHFQRLSDSEKKVMSWLANQNQSRRNFPKASSSRIIPFRIPKSRRIIETQVINRKSPKRRSRHLHSPTSNRRIHKNSHLAPM